jgi:hypothetical protein
MLVLDLVAHIELLALGHENRHRHRRHPREHAVYDEDLFSLYAEATCSGFVNRRAAKQQRVARFGSNRWLRSFGGRQPPSLQPQSSSSELNSGGGGIPIQPRRLKNTTMPIARASMTHQTMKYPY